jgi:hypothetical protein
MMRHQRVAVKECRMNERKDQETWNACGRNRTSVKAWGEQCNKGEYLICTFHFDFLNANLMPKNALGILPDFSNENLVSKNGVLSPLFILSTGQKAIHFEYSLFLFQPARDFLK